MSKTTKAAILWLEDIACNGSDSICQLYASHIIKELRKPFLKKKLKKKSPTPNPFNYGFEPDLY